MHVSPLATPVLALQVDAVKDIDSVDALPSLWTLFTKCKESLQDGRRLENISWRLWHRELVGPSVSPRTSLRSLSPPASSVSEGSEASETETESELEPAELDDTLPPQRRPPMSRRQSSQSRLPLSPISSKTKSKSRSPARRSRSTQAPRAERTISFSSQFTVSDCDRSEYMLYRRNSLVRVHSSASSTGAMPGPAIGKVISELLPEKLVVATAKNLPTSQRESWRDSELLDGHLHHTSPDHSHSAAPLQTANIAFVQPSTPPSNPSSSSSGLRVVVVHPTPHPTPPATPHMSSTTPAIAQPTNKATHLLPPSALSPLPPSSKPKDVPSRTSSPRLNALAGSPSPGMDSEASPMGASAGGADETLKTSQRLFFLQQSPQSEGDSATSASSGSRRGRPLIPASLMNSKNAGACLAAAPPHCASGPSSKSSTSTAVGEEAPPSGSPVLSKEQENNNKRLQQPCESSRSRSRSASRARSEAGKSGASVGSRTGGAFAVRANARKPAGRGVSARPGMHRQNSHHGAYRAHTGIHHHNHHPLAHHAPATAHGKIHHAKSTSTDGAIAGPSTTTTAAATTAAAAAATTAAATKAHKFKIGSASSSGSRSNGMSSVSRGRIAHAESERREREAVATEILAAGNAVACAGKGKEREARISDGKPQPPQQQPAAGVTATFNGAVEGQRKRIELHDSSSDFETTDNEESDDDSWASDDDEEESQHDRSRERTIQPPPAQGNRHHPHPQQQQQQQHLPQPIRNRHEHTIDNVRIDEAALRAQEHLDMFAKLPRRSYADLGQQRSRSGLLSTIFHPPPEMFPPGHPYRQSLSSQDIVSSQYQLQQQQQQHMQRSVLNPYPNPYTGYAQGQGHARQQWAPPQRMTGPVRSESATTAVASDTAAGMVIGSAGNATTATSVSGATTRSSPLRSQLSNGSTGYRPRGRPADAEVEDESDDEEDENPEDRVQMSTSAAQEKLAALAKRSGGTSTVVKGQPSQQSQQQHQRQQAYSDEQVQQAQRRQQSHSDVHNANNDEPRATLTSVASAPIPLYHPYNLPTPAVPFTPRTTRRNMLSNELSESLRRNLIWERRVSKTNMMGGAPRRQVGLLGGGLRPLTTMAPPMPGLVLGRTGERRSASSTALNDMVEEQGVHALQQQGQQGQGQDPAEREERRQAAMARHRSWLGDYHGAGW